MYIHHYLLEAYKIFCSNNESKLNLPQLNYKWLLTGWCTCKLLLLTFEAMATLPIFLQYHSSFSNFSCMFLNPNIFSNLDSNCSNLLDMRNLQEQVKKAFCYQKLFWPFTVRKNCSSDRENFWNLRLKAENLQTFWVC